VIGLDKQGRRVGKGLVAGEPAGLGVSVGADQRQIVYPFVQRAGNFAGVFF